MVQDHADKARAPQTPRGLGGRLFLLAPHPTVCFLMPDEVRALGEGLPTLVTQVGALPGVRPLVPDEVRALAEGLPAMLARVGPGPRVGPQVLGDGRAVVEGAPTLPAFERPLPGVDSLVLGERGALHERLPAVPAHVGLLAGVDFLVHREVPWVPERFAALAAPADRAPFVNPRERDLRGASAEGSPRLAALLMNVCPGIARHLFNPGATRAQASPGESPLQPDGACVKGGGCLGPAAVTVQLLGQGPFLGKRHLFQRRVQGLWGPGRQDASRGGGPGTTLWGLIHFQVLGGFFLSNVGLRS